ncbi:PD-(D/E)XK nuclease family protein [Ectobacillus ponti]|uniref:PD-(D/E)XK nuclease family protein n=1 Tax=Ectobacillus ponti TaxID=2961894 RepID=A0AA41X8C7_9BACI|nr:PD-(D/E)XK nuclease family protein [Ectobacillus ponti]MCP8970769.1 PD-(D/E)XK nuclease family protein [Ectobacillus ponti]
MPQPLSFPEFSWSLSRHKTLMDCARKYAYSYYASHLGWKPTAAPLSRHAYRLKQMKHVEMMFGEAVHQVIEEVLQQLRRGLPMPGEELLTQEVRRRLNQSFLDSKHKMEQWRENPKSIHMLHEMYYEGVLPEEKTAEIRERLAACVRNFMQSRTVQEILETKTLHFVEAEKFRSMYMSGVKVWVVLDFLYRDNTTGIYTIVDWKTGRETMEDRHQLALYAIYVQQKYAIPLEQIRIRNEYLLSGVHQEYALTSKDVRDVQLVLGVSVQEMQKYVADSNKNQPIDLADFEQTIHEATCRRCNFQELCMRG